MVRAKYTNVTITYKEQVLEVVGVYSPSRPSYKYETPPEDEMFEIETINYKGVDITDLFYELVDDDFELVEAILEQLNENTQPNWNDMLDDYDE